jgi:hypothetical protein
VLFLIYMSGMAGFIDSGMVVVMYMAETVELSSRNTIMIQFIAFIKLFANRFRHRIVLNICTEHRN